MSLSKALFPAAIVITAIFGSGCSTHEVKWDATQLRYRTLEYYTDQILDNLVRAKNGQFFLHVNISQINAQVSSELAGSVGGGETAVDTLEKATSVTGLATKATRAVTKPFSFSVNPKHGAVIALNAIPEINDPELYQVYLQFLNLPKVETNATVGIFSTEPLGPLKYSGLDVTDSDKIYSVKEKKKDCVLNEGEYVPGTLRRWHGREYYVPISYKQQYFDLCFALVSRIKPPKTKDEKAEFFRQKYDSQELRLLQQFQQKLDALQAR